MRVSETIGNEAVFLGVSILVGILLFLLYDTLRIFRRLVPHGVIWTGVEDFLYWLLCAVVVFLMLYQENDGMFRGYALGGLVAGALLYYSLLSRFVVGLSVWLVKQVIRFFKPIFRFFYRPVSKYGKKIMSFLLKQLKKIGKIVRMGLCKL